MFTWTRTAAISDGKALPATEWALKTAAYVSEKFDIDLRVMRNVTGQINHLHWVAEYETLEDFQSVLMRVQADEGYQSMVADATEQQLYQGNSIVDRLYMRISP